MPEKPKRLLILSCSARKSDQRLCPAIDRYMSPVYFVVRRYLKQASDEDKQNLNIFIVSARYGLISYGSPTEHYDEVMTKTVIEQRQAMHKVQAQILHHETFCGKFPAEVFCHLGENYRQAIGYYLEKLQQNTTIQFAKGPPGVKLGQLKVWLETGGGE